MFTNDEDGFSANIKSLLSIWLSLMKSKQCIDVKSGHDLVISLKAQNLTIQAACWSTNLTWNTLDPGCNLYPANKFLSWKCLFFIAFCLIPCNYQLSKSIVHEIKCCHVNINSLPYSDRYFNTDWQFEMFKRGKQWTWNLFSVYFKNGFHNFSDICCWYTSELPNRGSSNVHLQHMPIQ